MPPDGPDATSLRTTLEMMSKGTANSKVRCKLGSPRLPCKASTGPSLEGSVFHPVQAYDFALRILVDGWASGSVAKVLMANEERAEYVARLTDFSESFRCHWVGEKLKLRKGAGFYQIGQSSTKRENHYRTLILGKSRPTGLTALQYQRLFGNMNLEDRNRLIANLVVEYNPLLADTALALHLRKIPLQVARDAGISNILHNGNWARQFINQKYGPIRTKGVNIPEWSEEEMLLYLRETGCMRLVSGLSFKDHTGSIDRITDRDGRYRVSDTLPMLMRLNYGKAPGTNIFRDDERLQKYIKDHGLDHLHLKEAVVKIMREPLEKFINYQRQKLNL
ncbi:hypothetical protein HK104_003969 [Borealophlyctis nickersoniae]|nr:hypothetical protein HK104_003969 [Borealophlyctis nickersoniae]